MKTIEELIPFRFPIGFRFVLFDVKTRGGNRYVIADTPERASALATRDANGRARLVTLQSLIDKQGYNQTHNLLKRFGPEWIAKYNRVFYRHGPMAF